MMLAAPRKGDCSKVSMELSRWKLLVSRYVPFLLFSVSPVFAWWTHVEGSELGAVGVEGLVVEVGELLWG